MTGSFPGGTISLPEPPLSECTTAPVLSRRRPTQAQLKRAFRTRSIILNATAAMAGGTQLFEGAHLTSGNTRSCRESANIVTLFFVGQIIKYAL